MLKIQQAINTSQCSIVAPYQLTATSSSPKGVKLSDEMTTSNAVSESAAECNDSYIAAAPLLHISSIDILDANAHISEAQCLHYFEVRLGKMTKQGLEFLAHCPFHDDKQPSLSINLAKRAWYCHPCHVGGGMMKFETKYATEIEHVACDANKARQRIAQVLGLKEFSHSKAHEAIYPYTDADALLLFQVVRMPGKKFYQRRPNGAGGWTLNTHGVAKVLYHLPDVIAATSVIVVEGEKDADNLKAALPHTHNDWAVTTSPGGAGKWRNEFSLYFKGKHALILPDNDEAGREHANEVALSIHQYADTVKIVELPDLLDKGDVSDFLLTHTAAEMSKQKYGACAFLGKSSQAI